MVMREGGKEGGGGEKLLRGTQDGRRVSGGSREVKLRMAWARWRGSARERLAVWGRRCARDSTPRALAAAWAEGTGRSDAKEGTGAGQYCCCARCECSGCSSSRSLVIITAVC